MSCKLGNHIGTLKLRKKMGGVFCQLQCSACFRGVGKRIRLAMLADDGRSLGRWLTAVPGEGRGNSRTRKKQDFYRSKEWHAQRDRVLDRDDHTCRNCGDYANSVHHIRYAPILAETPDEDLVASCVPCNTGEAELRRGGMLR